MSIFAHDHAQRIPEGRDVIKMLREILFRVERMPAAARRPDAMREDVAKSGALRKA